MSVFRNAFKHKGFHIKVFLRFEQEHPKGQGYELKHFYCDLHLGPSDLKINKGHPMPMSKAQVEAFSRHLATENFFFVLKITVTLTFDSVTSK